MKSHRASSFRPVIALLALGAGAAASAQQQLPQVEDAFSKPSANLPTLTQVDQIRRLSLPESERNYPVELRGVVLDYSALPILFIADASGGIYVKVTTNAPLLTGQLVEIAGVSQGGRFAPMVIPSKLRVVGTTELPAPREVSFQSIASGMQDSQWVKVTGIVRSTGTELIKGKLRCATLTLATQDGGRLKVLVDDYHGEPAAASVDQEVFVTGIAESIYNNKRQLLNVRLLAPNRQFIEVKTAAPPEILAPRPVASLRQFSPEKPSGHRVKVRGIITLQRPGECIFLQDQTGSIRAETRQPDRVSPGERVEVLGFAAIQDHAPVLEDAVFHTLGSGPPPLPVRVTAKAALAGDHDADLIRLEARLLDQFPTPDQLLLLLQEGDILFRAQLLGPPAPALKLRNGARLQLTGICLDQLANGRSPRSFQVVLRSATDLAVLHQPSWWTPPRLRGAFGLLVGVLLGAGVWVWALKRQVRLQTDAIREKIEREAVLQERMRIAREFHDSLEQEIAGVRMQLELTEATVTQAPQRAIASLQMAKTMICHSQAEVRRSVWELRSPVLENRTLPAALSATVAGTESSLPVEVRVSGAPRPLARRVESHLLRMAQEAVNNAMKHARPRHVTVELAYEGQGARLQISDDGCGFNVADAPAGQQGHFGLLGLRERADKIGGLLRIISAPGQGTCIEVFVPQADRDLEPA